MRHATGASFGVYRQRWNYAIRRRALRLSPSKVTVGASVPGLEYNLAKNRLHWRADENRNHYSTETNRLHYKVKEED